jgi:hypothetical protein
MTWWGWLTTLGFGLLGVASGWWARGSRDRAGRHD